MMSDPVVDLFEKVEPLPTAPMILPKLLSALSDPDVDLEEVVVLVAQDPAMAATVLKLCNSAYFADSSPTADLRQAVTRVGLYNVYRLVVTACGQGMLSIAEPGWGVDMHNFWKHSVLTGLAAEVLATDCGEMGGPMFTAGLLHDFGKLLLAGAFEADYGRVSSQAAGDPGKLVEMERIAFLVDHAQLGGELLKRWNFPIEVEAAVRWHHSPETGDGSNRFSSIITVADTVAHLIQPCLSGCYPQ
ncbi:MAG: HDOD domain-containing protein [Pedosphaera sp.]|nr:HDOD domain-containing protein [Pedosphaera sp.]